MACSAPYPSESRNTILVAEDDAVVRMYVALVLRKAGYDVVEAEDGAQAMELFDATPGIRLVLTDVVMPRLGGDALCSHVAQRTPGTPVVFMSGYDYDFLLQTGRQVPECALMKKPMSGSMILESIGSLLGREGAAGGI